MIKWFFKWLKWLDGQLEGKPPPKYLSGKGLVKEVPKNDKK
jgi:hypothetical protein